MKLIVAALLAGILLLVGCSPLEPMTKPVKLISFDEYSASVIKDLHHRRNFQTPDTEMELIWNSPREWRPANSAADENYQKGVLLVHGLGDSPWSFNDIAKSLSDKGFLVRTVLLDGHGSNPKNMLAVTAEQWRETVYQQAEALLQDVKGSVYIGGFSTGGNLALEYAYDNPNIAGLLLFSPGFKSSIPLQWLTPVIADIKPWMITPEDTDSLQTAVRYMYVPTNGFAQYYRTSQRSQNLLKHPYTKPVFMVVSENDSVLDTEYLLKVFQTRFINPRSRLIWYGGLPSTLSDKSRIYIKTDQLESQRISQFSHMGILFSPENELYGRNGSLRICMNSLNEDEIKACEEGSELWFSAWGYHEDGKVHARLTFNPYFSWQNEMLYLTIAE